MNRTRAQSKLRRKGYTHEITYLREPFPPRKFIFIQKSHSSHDGPLTPRKVWRKHLLPGEIVRPIAKHYIHNGKRPV